jgi:hypothetical protein
MTPTDVATLIDHAPMPPGYELVVTEPRRYKYRSLWNVHVMYEGERIYGVRVYNLAAGIRMAQKAAWLTAGAGA